MSKPHIIVPGDDPPQLQGSAHLERLRKYGDVTLYYDRPGDAAEKIRRALPAMCLINSRSAIKWPGDVLQSLPNLRMITTCGIGTDAIDLETASRLGIVVSNVPGKTAPIVAEHALALMFAIARRAWFQTQELKQGRWTSKDNFYLRGKILGIIGTGPIGAEMARLGRAVGMNLLGWTFHPSMERASELGLTYVSLDELLQRSDVVSLHVKLTDKTRGLLGRKELAMMKRGALLVNSARGAVVDTNALVEALQSEHLGGAGIDVFDIEPLPPNHPLLACEQVVLTPHNADQTPEGIEFLNEGVVDNVIAFLEGRPQNQVAAAPSSRVANTE